MSGPEPAGLGWLQALDVGGESISALESFSMSSERRVYEVGYKLVFTGCAGTFEVDKVDGRVDISADKKKAWETIAANVRKMDPSEWELEFYCLKCGEYAHVDEENQAEFSCECTTETPSKV